MVLGFNDFQKNKINESQSYQIPGIKDSWEGFRDLIKVRLNALQGKYKI